MTGSENQIKWALNIQENAKAVIKSMKVRTERLTANGETAESWHIPSMEQLDMIEKNLYFMIDQITEAKFWIDNRDSFTREALEKFAMEI